MGLFFKVSNKELLEARNAIFIERGIPALEKNGYQKSPFTTSWHGRDNHNDFTYTFCRLRSGLFEILKINIIRGDRFIQMHLNIFSLDPHPKSLDELSGSKGLKFGTRPSNMTEMRLRLDDIRTIPLLNFTEHKVGSFYTQRGFKKRITELGNLIESDMQNIDSFVERWHELHTPVITDWEGNPIDSE